MLTFNHMNLGVKLWSSILSGCLCSYNPIAECCSSIRCSCFQSSFTLMCLGEQQKTATHLEPCHSNGWSSRLVTLSWVQPWLLQACEAYWEYNSIRGKSFSLCIFVILPFKLKKIFKNIFTNFLILNIFGRKNRREGERESSSTGSLNAHNNQSRTGLEGANRNSTHATYVDGRNPILVTLSGTITGSWIRHLG